MPDSIPDTGQDPRSMVSAGYAKVIDAEDAAVAIDRIVAGEDPKAVVRSTPHVWIPFASNEDHLARTATTSEPTEPAVPQDHERDQRRDILWDQQRTSHEREHTAGSQRGDDRDFARPGPDEPDSPENHGDDLVRDEAGRQSQADLDHGPTGHDLELS